MPDYSKYTLQDLYDVSFRVDKENYPERYAIVMQEIDKREAEHPNPIRPVRPSAGGEIVLGALLGAIIFNIAIFSAFPVLGYDGQAVMLLFLTVPVGAVLGVIAAVLLKRN